MANPASVRRRFVSMILNSLGQSGIWTTTTYDAPGRVIETQAPDSEVVTV